MGDISFPSQTPPSTSHENCHLTAFVAPPASLSHAIYYYYMGYHGTTVSSPSFQPYPHAPSQRSRLPETSDAPARRLYLCCCASTTIQTRPQSTQTWGNGVPGRFAPALAASICPLLQYFVLLWQIPYHTRRGAVSSVSYRPCDLTSNRSLSHAGWLDAVV